MAFSTNRFIGFLHKECLDLFKENQRLSENLGRLIDRPIEPISIPDMPENPAHETNRILDEMSAEFGEAGRLIKNINDLSVQLMVDSVAGTSRAQLWNRIMLSFGILTLLVTAGISFQSYKSSNAAAARSQELSEETNKFLETQIDGQNRGLEMQNALIGIENSHIDAHSEIADRIQDIGETVEGLDAGVENLERLVE